MRRVEQQRWTRLHAIERYATTDGCRRELLLGYFGQRREEPCGHCTVCLDGPVRLPEPCARPPIASLVDRDELTGLARDHPTELGEARQQARFLCGLSSPAVTAARLGRHALFGSLENHRFAEILTWCESLH